MKIKNILIARTAMCVFGNYTNKTQLDKSDPQIKFVENQNERNM